MGVRRAKAALFSGCKSHPATAPAGSNRDGDGKMALAGSGAADQNNVALFGDERPTSEIADKRLIDRCAGAATTRSTMAQEVILKGRSR